MNENARSRSLVPDAPGVWWRDDEEWSDEAGLLRALEAMRGGVSWNWNGDFWSGSVHVAQPDEDGLQNTVSLWDATLVGVLRKMVDAWEKADQLVPLPLTETQRAMTRVRIKEATVRDAEEIIAHEISEIERKMEGRP